MADQLQVENYTWKWFNETYHTQMHGISLFKAILALSRRLSRVTGVQRWLFLWLKQDRLQEMIRLDILCAILPFNTMDSKRSLFIG